MALPCFVCSGARHPTPEALLQVLFPVLFPSGSFQPWKRRAVGTSRMFPIPAVRADIGAKRFEDRAEVLPVLLAQRFIGCLGIQEFDRRIPQKSEILIGPLHQDEVVIGILSPSLAVRIFCSVSPCFLRVSP